MDRNAALALAETLSIDDRYWLVHEIIDSINGDFELTEEQKQELDRRIADIEANPDDAVPWEQVLADARERHRVNR